MSEEASPGQAAIGSQMVHVRSEGAYLGKLGLAYWAPGRVEQAIQFYEQALAISRETADRAVT